MSLCGHAIMLVECGNHRLSDCEATPIDASFCTQMSIYNLEVRRDRTDLLNRKFELGCWIGKRGEKTITPVLQNEICGCKLSSNAILRTTFRGRAERRGGKIPQGRRATHMYENSKRLLRGAELRNFPTRNSLGNTSFYEVGHYQPSTVPLTD